MLARTMEKVGFEAVWTFCKQERD